MKQHQEDRFIIALSHRANSGKTRTLRQLSFLLDQMGGGIEPLEDTRNSEHSEADFTFVLKIAGRIIAIESKGDPNCGLGGRLDSLVAEYKPHLIFCATRTSGGTVHAVDDTEREREAGIRYERIWTSTYQCSPNRWEELNALKARHLVELAQGLGMLPDS